MSYSNSGGPLTLQSPSNHHHNVDVGATLRSLRRSLSRSPSRNLLVRGNSISSESSLSSPNSPSPCRFTRQPVPPASAPPASYQYSQPLFKTPCRSPFKIPVRSRQQKAASAKPLSRAARLSPKSPLKRALNNAPDSGNPIPTSPTAPEPLPGQENNIFASRPLTYSPSPRKTSDKHQSRHSMHLDISGASQNTFPQFFDLKSAAATTSTSTSTTTGSPLKRSDAPLRSDPAQLGSPVAKRRSLHGISSFNDSTIFDNAPDAPHESFDIHEDPNREYELRGSGHLDYQADSCDSMFPPSPTPTAAPREPRRNLSLRKSTLQQRVGDKSSMGRRQGEKHLAQMTTDVSTSPANNARGRPRLSLDHFVQPELSRDSPFSNQAPLPNPSLHMVDRPNPQPQPHPLSRSLTTSSSNSSMADESITYVPVQFDKPRSLFAKSLPYGARPNPDGSNRNTATPAYKSALPLQDAFKSTGLISKKNWVPEPESDFGKSIMPDTPCKKQPIYPSMTYPPSSGGGKGRTRHSFGSPPTLFAPASCQDISTFGGSGKIPDLFKARPNHGRKNSVFIPDGDDMDFQSLGDMDFQVPNTPTRHSVFRSLGNFKSFNETPFASRTLPAPISAVGHNDARITHDPMCKSSPSQHSLPGTEVEDTTQLKAAGSPPALACRLSPNMSSSLPSFNKSRARTGLYSTPKPLKSFSATPLTSQHKRVEFAKNNVIITASPLGPPEPLADASPKTPHDNGMVLPDPSSLSISNHRDTTNAGSFGSFPPATPTSRQGGGLFNFADRRMSITPVNGGHGPADFDRVLSSRFDTVEAVGKGEFSQVFRVTEGDDSAACAAPLTSTPGTPPSPSAARVFAVKRIDVPPGRSTERKRKYVEVEVLMAIRGRQHVLQFVDHWEKEFRLYIQTEYCEEGSLERFLLHVGTRGRLDDFRIWKICVETSKGLQSIHEAGFIHLDLKPANILINFEGTIKIGDFGLATQWPAARSIEGEGDRGYVAQEILHGQYDKPADVFALGLIVFEMASNVTLPENGSDWAALRQGNISIVPALTMSESDAPARDATGMPIETLTPLYADDQSTDGMTSSHSDTRPEFPFNVTDSPSHNASDLFSRRNELLHPQSFMVDPDHPCSLDNVVRWMISPDPTQRPTVQQVLDIDSVRWVDIHRRAGATVYEGNWGPQDDTSMLHDHWRSVDESHQDTEMLDV